MNEGAYTFHMNECSVPSMCIPVSAVKHIISGIPTSIMLWGINDRELLGIALALEESLLKLQIPPLWNILEFEGLIKTHQTIRREISLYYVVLLFYYIDDTS